MSLFTLACLPGCSTSTGCTDAGCQDGTSISFHSPGDQWAAGEYELALVVDGKSSSCSMQLPEQAPSDLTPKSMNCESSDVEVSWTPKHSCETTSDDEEDCSSLPGQYRVVAQLKGTPDAVELQLKLDDAQLVESELELTYTELTPNGPDCGPVCLVSSNSVDVP